MAKKPVPLLTKIDGVPPSTEIRQALKEEGRPVLLAFSCGKDSIAAALALQDDGIPFIPYYMYLIPGRLDFVDESLDYFEQIFQQKIHRYPNPSIYRWLNNFTFQPPERCAIIEAADLPSPTYADVLEVMRNDLGIPADTWVCDGVRAADSIVRRTSFARHGPMKHNSRKVSPVWDWRKAAVMGRIERSGWRLPVDYQWFKRSFDGLDYRFLGPLAEHAPEDFARILEWFPLAELEIFRHGL